MGKYTSLLTDTMLVHVTCFGPWHVRGTPASHTGAALSAWVPEAWSKGKTEQSLRSAGFYEGPMTSISSCYSHDYVLVQGKRDFVDVIKSSNHLILRQGSYPDYLDSMSVSIVKTFLFWHRRRGNLRYWKQERNLLQEDSLLLRCRRLQSKDLRADCRRWTVPDTLQDKGWQPLRKRELQLSGWKELHYIENLNEVGGRFFSLTSKREPKLARTLTWALRAPCDFWLWRA